jgi:TetR/AcrR family transcriptional regulator
MTPTGWARQSGVVVASRLNRELPSEIVNERRRQQRSIDTRERILKAALKEFAAKGFGGTSTREVASKAGVPHPLVTYHFESKEGLWKAVVSAASFRFSEYFRDQLRDEDDSDPVERLRAIQEDFIRYGAKNLDIHFLMSHEARRESKRLAWLVEERIQQYFDGIAKLIRVAQERGCYVEGDPYHLQYLFIGAVTRVFMLAAEVRQVTKRMVFSKEFVEEHVRLCSALFFRDPAPLRGNQNAARSKKMR